MEESRRGRYFLQRGLPGRVALADVGIVVAPMMAADLPRVVWEVEVKSGNFTHILPGEREAVISGALHGLRSVEFFEPSAPGFFCRIVLVRLDDAHTEIEDLHGAAVGAVIRAFDLDDKFKLRYSNGWLFEPMVNGE